MELAEIFIYGLALGFGSGIIIAFFRMVTALFGEEKA